VNVHFDGFQPVVSYIREPPQRRGQAAGGAAGAGDGEGAGRRAAK